ncbi:MAG: hypothetical protein HFG28_03110 [Eubacterium sp.]|nr:hypothetical protein [Eubacterium sp.]
MKKAIITLNFDEEKTAALKLYLEQKGTAIEKELEKTLETLYTKSVPANVREFIALRSGDDSGSVGTKGKKQKMQQNIGTQEHKKDSDIKTQM